MFLSDLAELETKVRNVCNRAEQIMLSGDEFTEAAQQIVWDKSHETTAEISADCPELIQIQTALIDIRNAVFQCYLALTEPDDLELDLLDSAASSAEFDPKITAFFEVTAAVNEGALIVKMPLLWSRQTTVIRTSKGKFRADHLPWLRHELDEALAQIQDEIPQFARRNFSYLHVIPADAKQFTDSDNFDTKAITDIVTAHLTGDDNALQTTFSLFSMRAGQLASATYLMVTDAFGAPPDLDHLVQKIALSYAQKAPIFDPSKNA